MMKKVNSFNPKYKYDSSEEAIQIMISTSDYEKFNASLLDVGNIGSYSQQKDVIAAIFDLEGFTDFCSGVDPQLFVPSFLKDFIDWLYDMVKSSIVNNNRDNTTTTHLYSELPFFSKFLGDGILFLWNIDSEAIVKECSGKNIFYSEMLNTFLCNIIVLLDNISKEYENYYKNYLQKKYVNPPSILRCGIARGTVFSIGDGKDYVGPCINMASRLQKLNGLRFAFQARGIDVEEGMVAESMDLYYLKEVVIRGLGQNEHIYVEKQDFSGLDDFNKEKFKDI